MDPFFFELRPLTLFYGRNSAGKSAFLRSLLLLRQSLSSQPDQSPLIFVSDHGFDFGGYRTLVRDHDVGHAISFWFECELSPDVSGDASQMISKQVVEALSGLGVDGTTVQVRLSYRLHHEQVRLHEVALYDDTLSLYDEDKLIWKATAPQPNASADQASRFEADFFREQPASVWPKSALVVEEGFFPELRPLAPSPTDFLPEFCHIQQLLCHCKRSILAFFKTMEYIGPRRPDPQRFYHLTKESNGHSDHS